MKNHKEINRIPIGQKQILVIITYHFVSNYSPVAFKSASFFARSARNEKKNVLKKAQNNDTTQSEQLRQQTVFFSVFFCRFFFVCLLLVRLPRGKFCLKSNAHALPEWLHLYNLFVLLKNYMHLLRITIKHDNSIDRCVCIFVLGAMHIKARSGQFEMDCKEATDSTCLQNSVAGRSFPPPPPFIQCVRARLSAVPAIATCKIVNGCRNRNNASHYWRGCGPARLAFKWIWRFCIFTLFLRTVWFQLGCQTMLNSMIWIYNCYQF